VYLCTDSDEGGIEAAERIRDIFVEKGYTEIFRIAPQQKDCNDSLKQLHGAEYLPDVTHERKELYLQSVSELNKVKINLNRIANDLIAAYNSTDRIRLAEFCIAASEHFLKIAGEDFPLDIMKNRLNNVYKFYQDKHRYNAMPCFVAAFITGSPFATLRQMSNASHDFPIVGVPARMNSSCVIRLSTTNSIGFSGCVMIPSQFIVFNFVNNLSSCKLNLRKQKSRRRTTGNLVFYILTI